MFDMKNIQQYLASTPHIIKYESMVLTCDAIQYLNEYLALAAFARKIPQHNKIKSR